GFTEHSNYLRKMSCRLPGCRLPWWQPGNRQPATSYLRFVRVDVNLDAAVQLTTAGGGVRRTGVRFAVADGPHARGADAEIVEVIRDRCRAAFRQALVVRGRAGRVGVALDRDRGVRVAVEDVGHLTQRAARGRAKARGVEVEQHVVLHRDLQFVVRGAGDVDAFDLPELALLLVHHGADDRAGSRTGHTADDRAALGAVVTAVVSDDRSDDRAERSTDHRALLGLRVIIGLGEEWNRQKYSQRGCE